MTEKRTGQRLANRAAETDGFSIRPADGLKVVVRNEVTRKQRTVPLQAVGREYDNCVKKLKQIGWTEEVWRESVEAKRQDRLDRSAEQEAEVLKALQDREASDAPVPVAPGVDKVMQDLLTEALVRVDTLKDRIRTLHQNNLRGEVVKPEAAMDLLTIHMASMEQVVALTDEMRRRGMVAKSMR